MTTKCGKCFAIIQDYFPCANPDCTPYMIYTVKYTTRAKDMCYMSHVEFRRKANPASHDPYVIKWTWIALVQ